MYCGICSDFPTSENFSNDCIIEYLDKIKIHYNKFKECYHNNKSISEKLKSENEDLHKKISELEEKLLLISNSSCKRRRSSFESDADIENKSITPSSKQSPEELNDLNQAMDITDVDWSESFDLSSQDNKMVSTPTKCSNAENNTKDRKILSPLNKNISLQELPTASSLHHAHLPRRLKLSASKKETHNENQNSENTSKWIKSKDSNISIKNVNKDLGMSFIQPHRTSNISKTNLSPTTLKGTAKSKDETLKDKSKTSPKNNLSFKSNSKLRQTKLIFDIVKDDKKKQIPDADETFCDDFVEPSPTSAVSYIEEGGKMTRKKNLSNFSRKKSENLFTFAVNKSNKSDFVSTNNTRTSPGNSHSIPDNIKKDKPNKTVKSIDPNAISKSPEQTFQKDSSSVILLSNEPDEVIIIDNTDIDYSKFHAKDLIDEMVGKTEEISTFCGTIENNDTRVKTPEKKPITNIEYKNENKELDEVLKSACIKCREYFKCIGRHLSTEELKLRLRNCKHANIDINLTPEGFWDPLFRPFPEDDPRNETLIHEEFINS